MKKRIEILSHARSFTFPDSTPTVSLHAHHGLMDGIHAGQFIDRFQELMNEN